MRRRGRPSRRILLCSITLGAVGSGLFLPIELLYLIRVVGLATATAGLTMATAAALSLALPAVTGAMVDRFGSAKTFLVARCTQIVGAAGLLLVHGVVGGFFASLFVMSGMRMFWSSVFAVVSDVVGEQDREHGFALTGMVESAGVAAGGLLAGVVLSLGDSPHVYRFVVACNAALFMVGTLMATRGVRWRDDGGRGAGNARSGYRDVLRHRSFLAFVLASVPATMTISLFARVLPVYAVSWLHAPAWVPGMLLGWITAVSAATRGSAVKAVVTLSRSRTVFSATSVFAVWTLALGAAVLVPDAMLVAYLFALTLPFLAADLLHGPVANALVESLAPGELRGRYLAAFQYTYGVSDTLAPAFAALLVIWPPLPWLVATVMLLLAAACMPAIFRRFPDTALRRVAAPSP